MPNPRQPAMEDPIEGELFPDVLKGLKQLYREKVRPVEEMYRFADFHSPYLNDADFDAKPMVLLLGQYSVGKTTFIEYLLERNFPGQRIGPEPTTDRFVAVLKGEEEMTIPGNALSIQEDKPFRALQKFGTAFLSKLEASVCKCPMLDRCMFVDTPGVLSGEKQRIGRSYDFVRVCEWFAERADLILLLFDAHKLDISDEFKNVIETLRGHDDKIRVVLNKADRVSPQQLMRVYGALMWSLGKVIRTPEVMRVYIGSFWAKPYQNDDNRPLFEAESRDLLSDLRNLPRNNAVRKVNELVKRARLAKVHAYIISTLKAKMPSMFGKDSKQKELIDTLGTVFEEVKQKYRIPMGDFPDLERFRDRLTHFKFSEFPKLNPPLLEQMDQVLAEGIPRLMQRISPPKQENEAELNPFAEVDPMSWAAVDENKHLYDKQFFGLNPGGPPGAELVTGGQAKKLLQESGLENSVLRRIWALSDLGKDGNLDQDEFALACHLIKLVQEDSSVTLPAALPAAMMPPGKLTMAG